MDIFSDHIFIQTIMALVHSIQTQNQEIIFIWAASHIGIRRNHLADSRAKQATENKLHQM